ncbi:Fusaridione A cluster transcription factor fsdR [Colletotrichum sidae]|uniref:Fusaridione A cluster transcription factor fsdR n=1 Tax=Colletotrichum sidae TaxID=1347389 RepID=A0A4V3I3G4_9PEZI|nr:Fusaridione A cluster transcription factor fsdR [Colletotrichum sidae]
MQQSSEAQRLYENIVARLAQMESFVKELQEAPANVSPPGPKTPDSPPSPTQKESRTSPQNARRTSSATGASQISPQLPPSPATSSPRASKLYYTGAASEATIGTSGQCSLFSLEGIAKIDTLVGDRRFSDCVRNLLQNIRTLAPQRSIDFAASQRDYPFPSNDVIIFAMNDFFSTLNRGIRLLEEAEVRAAVQAYMYGQPSNQPGWKLALNVILAHSLYNRDWHSQSREYERYLYNALSLIPNAILQTPNPMTIGALLSLASCFVFSAENHIAVPILAVATQLILLAGYHNPDHPHCLKPSDQDTLHRRRLFWQAYAMDHDLMLRIGKPPLISDDFLLDLPEEFPHDGYGVYYFPDNVALSFFHQQVRLARIQGQIFSKLYFKTDAAISSASLESEIAALDAELQDWREGIPEMIRPEPGGARLPDDDFNRTMALSVLHFMYFQLVVAVHSAAFRLPLLDDDTEALRPSAALCVNAARAAIALLRRQNLSHPFTTYVLYQVSWSVDILFVNILEHRSAPQSAQDLELIRTVLAFFERYDANHQRVPSYHIIKALCEVASSVVLGAPAVTPEPAPPSTFQRQPAVAEPGMGGFAAPSIVPLPGLNIDIDWGSVSLGGHDWLSAGFLQMTDWGVQAGAGGMEFQVDPDPTGGSHG